MNQAKVFEAHDNGKDYDSAIRETTALFVAERLTVKTDYYKNHVLHVPLPAQGCRPIAGMRFQINVADGFLTTMTQERAIAVAWARDAILNGHVVYDKDGRRGRSGSLKGMHRDETPFPEH